ncbi:hypothetical protein [Ideonella margarita]|uniref:Uncharacterized protein n=1 Tax=Ideonella margarita TaxID=2984191 RepID=A0ABU9C824_9BURK
MEDIFQRPTMALVNNLFFPSLLFVQARARALSLRRLNIASGGWQLELVV